MHGLRATSASKAASCRHRRGPGCRPSAAQLPVASGQSEILNGPRCRSTTGSQWDSGQPILSNWVYSKNVAMNRTSLRSRREIKEKPSKGTTDTPRRVRVCENNGVQYENRCGAFKILINGLMSATRTGQSCSESMNNTILATLTIWF